MKQVTKYQADNGKIFDTSEDAEIEDARCKYEDIFNDAIWMEGTSAEEIVNVMLKHFKVELK